MAEIHVIKPDGTITKLPADDKLDIRLMYLAIGCNCVERIKVRYEGRVRDAYLDEEGLYRPNIRWNSKIKELAEAYYGRTCQQFAGTAAIWIPTSRSKKPAEVRDPAHCGICGHLPEECQCHENPLVQKKLDTSLEDFK
jgi:hypothetical protein